MVATAIYLAAFQCNCNLVKAEIEPVLFDTFNSVQFSVLEGVLLGAWYRYGVH